jgi:hypothetical protein
MYLLDSELNMERSTSTRVLILLSVIMTILAGIIHLVLVSAHMEHAPAHGLFFLLVGIAQIIWGILVWRQPSQKLYYVGVVMAGWLIILYAVTRLLPAPFSLNAWRAISLVLLVSVVAGFLTYGIARAAESVLPWLASPAEEHQYDENAPPGEEHHHNESLPGSFL